VEICGDLVEINGDLLRLRTTSSPSYDGATPPDRRRNSCKLCYFAVK